MATFTKRGDGWRAQVRRKGVSLSETFKTKLDAVTWARGREHEIDIGKLKPGTVHTVADAMREYEKRVSSTKRAARWEAIRFAAFIRDFPHLAAMLLADLTAEHMGRWRDARLAGDGKRRAVGTATVLREINLYSHMFTTARDEWKWITDSPFSGMRRPSGPQPRSRKIADDEASKIIRQLGYVADAAPKTKSQRIACMFLWALETAMRAGEISAMEWDWLDVDRRYVSIPKHITKTGYGRDVPLSVKAQDILKQMEPLKKEFEGQVFGVRPDHLSALFRKATNSGAIADVTFHDTRRTALTRLAKIFNVMELSKISGHRDVKILMAVYYAPSAEDLADKLHQVST